MNKKRCITILMLTILVLDLLFITGNVFALPINWVTVDDFDDCLIDDTSGNNSYYNWSRTSGSHFIIDGSEEPGGDKYLQVGYNSDASPNTDEGYFNYTLNYFGFYDRFKGYASSTTVDSTNTGTVFYNWYNTSNEIVVKMKVYWMDYYWGSGALDHYTQVYYMNSQDTWVKIYDSGYQTTFYEYYISWQYHSDNILQYKVYDSTPNRIAIANATGLIGGDEYISKEQFNCSNRTIVCQLDVATEGYTGFRIYSHGYIDETIYGEDTYPELDGVIIETYLYDTWITGVPDIPLGATATFRFSLIGDDGCRACISICNETQTLLWVCTLDDTYTLYYTFNKLGDFYLNIIDPVYYPDGYDAETNFTVFDGGMPDFDAIYGQFYVQFYTTGEPCYYIDGMNPKIVYKLNDSVNFTSVDDRFYIDIYQFWAMGETRLYTTIKYMGDESIGDTISGIDLYNQYEYEIRVFNATKNPDGTYKRDEQVYTSMIMTPCADLNNNGIPDEYEDYVPDDDDEEDDDTEWVGIPNEVWGGIIGLFIVFFLLIFPTLISRNWRNKLPKEVNIFSGMIGVIGCTIFGLFDLVVIFFIALILVAYIVLRVKKIIG